MPQKVLKMFLCCALGLAWLMCGFTTLCEPALGVNAASKDSCYRETCNGIEFDRRQAVCCENHFHPGAGLSCCGKQPFNPGTATCCKVGHGHTITANVTQGLSEEVSTCCGLEAYNAVNEICCESTIVAKPAPMAQCCGKDAFDKDKQLCCGLADNKLIVTKKSAQHQCCGHNQFNTKTQCCCWKNETHAEIRPNSLTAQTPSLYNKLHKLCCQPTAVAKPAPEAQPCGNQTFAKDKQLCCGWIDDKKILPRHSRKHQCCGYNQFNTETECCCWKNVSFAEIRPKRLNCCAEESGAQQQKFEPQPKCTQPNTSRCGLLCYNPDELRCCERNQTTPHWSGVSDHLSHPPTPLASYPNCSTHTPLRLGQCDAVPAVYNPQTHVCCDGRVSQKKPWIDQCCGETPYGLAQRGILCCNNILYKDREDGEECSSIGIPYDPAKWTICCSQFHDSPGQHCCGTEVFWPQDQICCHGHSHRKGEHIHCCGVKAYNIKDRHMKCCAGTLHDLTSFGKNGGDAQCCGSILQNPQNQEVCCRSEDKEVHYSAKTGYRCCGHRYYNSSLWSCCAGRLNPVYQPGQHQSKMIKGLLSVSNLKETHLCKELYVGIVESVSLHSIVFSSVLKIHGRNATVKPLALHYILQTPDRCNSPKLIPGKFYFFDADHVFTDFNHDSVPQSLHFIISKCSPYVTTA